MFKRSITHTHFYKHSIKKLIQPIRQLGILGHFGQLASQNWTILRQNYTNHNCISLYKSEEFSSFFGNISVADIICKDFSNWVGLRFNPQCMWVSFYFFIILFPISVFMTYGALSHQHVPVGRRILLYIL